MSTAAAAATLRDWVPPDPGQAALREAFLGFLTARPLDGCRRSCRPGHLTASTVVVDSELDHVLLTLHRRFGRWLQVGGHCEPQDASLAAAALREAREETGIPDLALDPDPLLLDVHRLTCSLGRPTRHFDVRFVARAPAGAQEVHSPESADLRWWPVHALPTEDDLIPQLVRLSCDRLGTVRAASQNRQNSNWR